MKWTDRAGNETGYELERKQGAGEYSGIASLPSNSSRYLDGSVGPDIGYTYRLHARNNIGKSASVEADGTTPKLGAFKPQAPVSLTASPVTQTGSIELKWADRSIDESGFKIERKFKGASSFIPLATVAPNVETYTDPSPWDAFIYRVYAYDQAGNSEFTNEARLILPTPGGARRRQATRRSRWLGRRSREPLPMF